MSSGSGQQENGGAEDKSLKLAVAISLLRYKFLQKQPSFPSPSQSDAHRWKQKAKERKQEILRLREDLKQAEGTKTILSSLLSASCKCYFFDRLGKLSPKPLSDSDGSDRLFNDVLRRRFIRQVRFKERRRKTGCSVQRRRLSDLSEENELEQLGASVDFIVALCSTASPVEANFANLSHQAVDFILASLKSLLSMEKNMELIEGIISSLITRLVKRMCSPIQENGSNCNNMDAQLYFQHLIRKLGSERYIGQRVILFVSQRISVLAESLLFTDPFDIAFPHMHESINQKEILFKWMCQLLLLCGQSVLKGQFGSWTQGGFPNRKLLFNEFWRSLSFHQLALLFTVGSEFFTMIQLIEFLESDYLSMWSKNEGFDKMLFEEWVASILHARKALELLESRNGLYVLYVDRVIGELAKQVGQILSLHDIGPEILDKLQC